MNRVRLITSARALIVMLVLLAGCSGEEVTGSTTSSAAVVPVGPSTTAAPPVSSTSTSAKPAPTTSTTAQPTTTAKTEAAAPAMEYVRLPVGERKLVAFTFDAAYDPAPLKDILSSLEQAGIRATFFLTGEFVEDFPESVRAIVAAGHPIGNHSYSHPDFTKLGPEEARRQLRKTAELLQGTGAADPRPLFRPPFGARNGTVLARLAEEGYVSVYWTIDTLDWKPERTPEQVHRSVLDKLTPGAIVLMHVGSKQTAEILPEMIRDVRGRGYEFVTVEEVLPGGQ